MKLLAPARWIAAIAILLLTALLCWQCVDIYMTGNAPVNLDAEGVHLQSVYRMDDVAVRLNHIAIPLIVCIALIFGAGVLHTVFEPKDRSRGGLTAENRLRLKKARLSGLPDEAMKEEHLRRGLRLAAAAAILLCAVVCLIYLLDGSHFTSWDLESVMGSMMLHVAPWVAVAFSVAMAVSMLCRASIERELALLQQIPGDRPSPRQSEKENHVAAIRIVLYIVAVVFIVLGVMNGGLRDVLVKAINICTECIGLG